MTHDMASSRIFQLFALTGTQTLSTNTVTGLEFVIRKKMCLEYALMNWVCQPPARVKFSAGRKPTTGATHVYCRTSQIVRMYSMYSMYKKEIDDLLNLNF
jgi:hypothetical protein